MIKLSQIFRPFNVPPRNRIKLLKSPTGNETESKGYKLLCQYGFIRQSLPGMYSVLPMGQRVIEKLTRLLDHKMTRIGALKMSMPFFSHQSLWKKAETYEKSVNELYQLTDRRDQTFVLNPTHEQSFSHLLSTEIMSYKDFPKLLYQIAPKFRDELRPKLGLLRSKEFLMKDLYSFDIGPTEAEETYNKVTAAYDEIFNVLGINFVKSVSLSESGVSKAHEYFYFSEVGDDRLYHCKSCEFIFHASTLGSRKTCPECCLNLNEEGYKNALEVAHTFSFGTYFSDRIGSCYVNIDCQRAPLYLCSFGIGVSRLVSACAEILSNEEGELRWPLSVAPYTVCVIPPKSGSKEEAIVKFLLPDFYQLLEAIPTLQNDILIDDRTDFTIGRRFMEAKLTGFPFIIIIGRDVMHNTPLYELHDLSKNKKYLMPKFSLLQLLIKETETLFESSKKTAYIAEYHNR